LGGGQSRGCEVTSVDNKRDVGREPVANERKGKLVHNTAQENGLQEIRKGAFHSKKSKLVRGGGPIKEISTTVKMRWSYIKMGAG